MNENTGLDSPATAPPSDNAHSTNPSGVDAAQFDVYVRTEADIIDPPASFVGAIKQIGPGLILTASIVGTGELIATTSLGSKAGFVLLWLVIISCFIKVFAQIELGRYAISAGRTTLQSFKCVPAAGTVLCYLWLIMMLVTQLQIGAMIGGIGQTLSRIAPSLTAGMDRPELPWAAFIAAATALLLVLGSYRVIEQTTTFLVCVFTVMTVVCLALLPWTEYSFGWADLASGLTFHIPNDREALIAAFAVIGITGVGASELVAYPYWCIEKGYARNVGPNQPTDAWTNRARGWIRVMRFDAWASMAVYTVATLAFFLLGAAVLHHGTGEQLPDDVERMIDRLASMYEPVMGATAAGWFIGVGAFMVLFSTLFAATAGNSRTTADFLFVTGLVQNSRPSRRSSIVRILCVAFPLLGLILHGVVGKPRTMVVAGGVAQALMLPAIAAVALYLRYKQTDRRIAAGGIGTLFLWISLAVFTIAATFGLLDQLGVV